MTLAAGNFRGFDGCKRSDIMLSQKALHEQPEVGDQFGLALGAGGRRRLIPGSRAATAGGH